MNPKNHPQNSSGIGLFLLNTALVGALIGAGSWIVGNNSDIRPLAPTPAMASPVMPVAPLAKKEISTVTAGNVPRLATSAPTPQPLLPPPVIKHRGDDGGDRDD